MNRTAFNRSAGNGNGQSIERFENLPPHDVDAEMCLIGSMMLDAGARDIAVAAIETSAALFLPDHQILFDAIARLHRGGRDVDAVILRAALRAAGLYEEIGGDAYVGKILNKVPSAAHASHYAGIVSELAKQRRLIGLSEEIQRAIHLPGAKAETILERAREEIGEVNAGNTFRPTIARQFLENPPELREPLITGILRRGEIMNIVGAPKSRKSWMVDGLILSFIARRNWLGSFPTAGGKVLLIDNELHPETIANRIPRIASALGIHTDEYADDLHIESLRGRLCDLRQLERKIRTIPKGTYRLIVLDAMYRFFWQGFEENGNADWTALMNMLDRWAAMLDCAIILIHHSSKGIQSNKSVTDTGAGAGAQSRAADTHLIIREHEEPDCAVLDGVLRSWEPIQPIGIRWHYPAWQSDPDLDVARLKKDPSRGGRPRKDAAQGEPEPVKVDWTPELFAAQFLDEGIIAKDALTSKANRSGITFRAIAGLIAEAEGAGLIHRHSTGTTCGIGYSTRKPDLFTESNKETHTPPVPPSARRKRRRDTGK